MLIINSLITASLLLFSAENKPTSHPYKITSIGIYLDVPDYDQSAFALMEQAEEAMQEAFPGIPWQTIDSSSTKALTLPAALPLLGSLTQAKPDSQAIQLGLTASKAYGYSHLLLIQRGGTRAPRDSSAQFGDAATFTLLEASNSTAQFSHSLHSIGQRAAKNSAETAWAQGTWKGFVNAWKTKPRN